MTSLQINLVGRTGACPHCGTTVVFSGAQNYQGTYLGHNDGVLAWMNSEPAKTADLAVSAASCPACKRVIMIFQNPNARRVIWPEVPGRPPVPSDAPAAIVKDYREAALVLQYSPNASAALSRRCLQHLLTAHGFAQGQLWQQIDAALPTLPAYTRDGLHELRHMGNFAAHPETYAISDRILDVEEHEAEWQLEVLDQLFEHYYALPAKAAARRAEVNAKLLAAGKKPIGTK